jgi:hypothetical protein
VQVVGYERDVGAGASLLLASDGEVTAEPLEPGAHLGYTLGERHCAGVLAPEGHRPCANERAPYCDAHDSTWVCARCTGTCLKAEMDCHQAHAVYLAAFAPATFKVGVTRLERLETRLREQGADRAAHVLTFPDGRVAREREAEIATTVGDSVRTTEKVASLARSVDEAAWERLLADFDPHERFAFDHGFDLADQPVPETMASGTVVGTKGRLLVLERNGSTYAVDMRDLVGHELEAGTSERELQASLGAFG